MMNTNRMNANSKFWKMVLGVGFALGLVSLSGLVLSDDDEH